MGKIEINKATVSIIHKEARKMTVKLESGKSYIVSYSKDENHIGQIGNAKYEKYRSGWVWFFYPEEG